MFTRRSELDMEMKKILIMGILALGLSGYMTIVIFDLFPAEKTPLSQTWSLISNSGTIQTWGIIATQLPSSGQRDQSSGKNLLLETGNITLALPVFMMNSGFEELQSKLKAEGINLNFEFFTGIVSKNSKADIILSTYQDSALYSWKIASISFPENPEEFTLSSIFFPFISDFYQSHQGAFIPFAIDPLITVIESSSDPQLDQITRENIYNQSLQTSKKNPLSQSLVFGIDNSTIRLLRNGQEPFPGYNQIFYQLMKQLTLQNLPSALSNIVDINTNQLLWKYPTFKKTLQTIAKRASQCETAPHLCILAYGLWNIGLMNLSDIDKWNTIFSGSSKKTSDMKFYNFPLATGTYPVQLRGLSALTTHPEKKNMIQKTVTTLLSQWANGSLDLWNTLIPPFNSLQDQIKQKSNLAKITPFLEQFEIITQDQEFFQKRYTTSSVFKLFEKTFTPEQYLAAPAWSY